MRTIAQVSDAVSTPAVVWAGLDVGKAMFDAAVCVGGPGDYALRDLPVQTFARTAQGASAFIQWLDQLLDRPDRPVIVRAVMEATGKYSQELAAWLSAQRPTLAPAIINPQQACAFTKSLFLRNFTDKIAARSLACYGMERRPAPYIPLTPEQAALRDLSRYRETLVAMRVAQENRIAEGSESPYVRQAQKRILASFKRQIASADKELRKQAAAAASVQRDARLLQSIDGVGFLTAVTILAELGNLRRFERGRQLSAFAGVSPRNIQSGTSVSKRPRMCKKGAPRLRRILYLSAMVAIRGDNDLSATYQHLIAQGKSRMAALGAVMRKLLLVMRAVLISGKPYDPHHARCGKPLLKTTLSA